MSDTSDLPSVTRVAAYALARDDAARLLLVRIAPGYQAVGQWTLPGGGLNFGEEPAAAVVRELEEETGLRGEIEGLAFVHSYSRGALPSVGDRPFHAIQIVYSVRIAGGELRHEVDESTDMAAWVSLDELHDLSLVDLVERALSHIETDAVALAD